MLPALGNQDTSVPATVPVPDTMDTQHHFMWVRTIIVTLPLFIMVNALWYTIIPLWDGKDCYTGSYCCDDTRQPWFWRTLKQETNNDITVRWCADRGSIHVCKYWNRIVGNLHPLTHVVLTHTCRLHQYSTHT